jgi:hypothetical protein
MCGRCMNERPQLLGEGVGGLTATRLAGPQDREEGREERNWKGVPPGASPAAGRSLRTKWVAGNGPLQGFALPPLPYLLTRPPLDPINPQQGFLSWKAGGGGGGGGGVTVLSKPVRQASSVT